MAFNTDMKAVRDYILTAVSGVWGVTSHEPPETVQSNPYTQIQTASISFEPLSLGASDMATVTYVVGGRFARTANLDDAKIDKLHGARDAILADPHAGGSATLLTVASAEFGDDSTMDGSYEVVLTIEALITADRP